MGKSKSDRQEKIELVTVEDIFSSGDWKGSKKNLQDSIANMFRELSELSGTELKILKSYFMEENQYYFKPCIGQSALERRANREETVRDMLRVLELWKDRNFCEDTRKEFVELLSKHSLYKVEAEDLENIKKYEEFEKRVSEFLKLYRLKNERAERVIKSGIMASIDEPWAEGIEKEKDLCLMLKIALDNLLGIADELKDKYGNNNEFIQKIIKLRNKIYRYTIIYREIIRDQFYKSFEEVVRDYCGTLENVMLQRVYKKVLYSKNKEKLEKSIDDSQRVFEQAHLRYCKDHAAMNESVKERIEEIVKVIKRTDPDSFERVIAAMKTNGERLNDEDQIYSNVYLGMKLSEFINIWKKVLEKVDDYIVEEYIYDFCPSYNLEIQYSYWDIVEGKANDRINEKEDEEAENVENKKRDKFKKFLEECLEERVRCI